MKGNDMELMKRHREEASMIAEDLKKDESVVGVVLLGGAARGFVDEFSDLDIGIFFAGEYSGLMAGEHRYNGLDLDVMLFDYGHSLSSAWSHAQRQAFQESKILFDRNGELGALIKDKLVYSMEERLSDMLDLIMRLQWRGFKPEKIKIPGDYDESLPYDLMAKRGCTACSHFDVNESLDLAVQLLYSFNHEFIPDHKWRLNNSFKLKWTPKNYKSRVSNIIRCVSVDKSELKRRAEVLNGLLTDILAKIQLDREIPENGYEIFLKLSNEYNPRQ